MKFKVTGKRSILFSLLLLSFIYTFFISQCSPLAASTPTGDYEIFYLIGKMWSEGYIPYVDMFDHKGPVIFFLYMIGGMISSRYGVYILQTIALWVVLYFAWQIQYNEKKKLTLFRLLCILLILAYLPLVEYQYPLTETFCLPFLMISAYEMYRYLGNLEQEKKHTPRYALIYGVTFGICFYTRVTNACVLFVWVFAVTLILIVNRQWKNLLDNILAFLCGVAIVLIPFLLYFAKHDAVIDMLNGTILFNVDNTIGITSAVGFTGSLRRMIRISPAWFCIILCVITRSVDWRIRLTHSLAAIISIIVISLGYAFGHYSIILTVFIPVDLYLVIETCKERKLEALNIAKKLLPVTALLIIAFCAVLARKIVYPSAEETAYETASKTIISYVPEEDRDEVIGFDTDSNFYLYADIRACFKYFTFQSKQMRYSKTLQDENVEYYRSGSAKWIIVDGWITNDEIQNAIDENYSMVQTYMQDGVVFNLYKRNELIRPG